MLCDTEQLDQASKWEGEDLIPSRLIPKLTAPHDHPSSPA